MGGSHKGFTLIELLIVVAIIAILAAIAVPNFLEAQTRAKVSRTKADMRSVATALEAYYVDSNTYPACHTYGIVIREETDEPFVLERLSTPVAYLSSVIVTDPFKVSRRYSASTAEDTLDSTATDVTPADVAAQINSYIYQCFNTNNRFQTEGDSYTDAFAGKGTGWVLHSCGPDSSYINLGGIIANDYADALPYTVGLIYDPTNGTVSFGSIWRASSGRPGPSGRPGSSDGSAAGEGLFMAIDHQK